jgi:phosphoribosylformylglycinamidine cyclo-ligase
LARHIVFERMRLDLDDRLGDTGRTVADGLLATHRSYYRSITPVLDRMHGLAHITGGGIPGNLVRVLPAGCEAVVDPDAWELPALFVTLQEAGNVSIEEMRDVFNLGIGLIAILPRDAVAAAQSAAAADGVQTWVIGEIRRGAPAVKFARR